MRILILLVCMMIVVLNANAAQEVGEIIKQAKLGDSDAQYSLGLLHLDGDGVEKDEKKALTYIKSAADAGIFDAQYQMALFYGQGKLVPKNEGAALRLLHQLADQGHPMGMFTSGYYLLSTSGPSAATNIAVYALWDLVPSMVTHAVTQKSALAKTMTAEQLNWAKALSQELKYSDGKMALIQSFRTDKLRLKPYKPVVLTKAELIETWLSELNLENEWGKQVALFRKSMPDHIDQAKADVIMEKFFSYPVVKPRLAAAYAKIYSVDELAVLVDFARSKYGKSFIKHMFHGYAEFQKTSAGQHLEFLDTVTTVAEREYFKIFLQSEHWQSIAAKIKSQGDEMWLAALDVEKIKQSAEFRALIAQ